MNMNPNCDGACCVFSEGEVRKLLYGSSGGNMILCRECYEYEMSVRQHNIEQGISDVLILWEDLEVYDCG